MKVFKKRESIVQNIAYMGIMAAINIIFIIMTYFIPFLLFVLVLVLPLCSAIITFYCKKIYFPIYFVVVAAICLLIDLSDGIFYVIPSLITGFIFGLMIDKKIPSVFIIVSVTIVQFGLSLVSIPLIQLLTNRNIVTDMATLFKINEYEYLSYVKYAFIFFVAFAQTILSFLVMHSELNKFGMIFIDKMNKYFVSDIIVISLVGLSVAFAFIYPDICYLFLLTSLIFLVDRLINLNYQHYKVYVIELAIIVLITIFFVALVYRYIPNPLGLLTLGILPVLISIACIINNCLLSKHNKDTIIE